MELCRSRTAELCVLLETVPFGGDGAEVGVEVFAFDAGEVGERDGGDGGVGFWGCGTFVGVVDDGGDCWGVRGGVLVGCI